MHAAALFSIALLQVYAQAEQYQPTITFGANPESFEAASQSPDFTVSTTFGNGGHLLLRINITKIPVDDATDSSGQAIADAHIVDTVYDLTWPDSPDDDYQEVLEDNGLQTTADNHFLCATILDLDLPQSVVDRYNPQNDSSCTSAFGPSCVSAILDLFNITADTNSNGCPSAESIFLLDECADVFRDGAFSKTTGVVGGNPHKYAYQEGSAFYSSQTEAFAGNNQTVLDTESQRFQAAVLTVVDELKNQTVGMSNQMVCTVANKNDTTSSGPTSSPASSPTSSSTGIAGPTAMAATGALLVAGIGLVAGTI